MKDNSLLHRQINPSFVVNDIVSNQAFIENTLTISSGAFNPTEKDEDKLSVYNGEKFSAKDAYEHYTTNFKSHGVLSLTVEEVESIPPLSSTEDNIPFDGHCYVDFSSVTSKNQKLKKAGKLRDIAVKRNWTYKP
ncbi:hypothetical protein [Flectobacillus longus]|uniref:hypothetical protein n=1 Tax=Flectobacillus longus TaxID=2984207 RepID=UPI0024B68218|nr:hypothetical protein [Flectobacillus longus]MDI9879859.1 hypothetical protein [Flectobacillus longus]